MQINKKKMIYAGLLLAAGTGLAADRLAPGTSVSGPRNGEAAALPGGHGTALPTSPVEENPAPTGLPVPLTDRLERINLPAPQAKSQVRDLFATPESWSPPAESAPLSQRSAAAQSALEQFRKDHKLKAIFTTGRHNFVLVNDRTVGLDQIIDGYRLLRIGDVSADFAAADHKVTLRLDGQPTGRGTRSPGAP